MLFDPADNLPFEDMLHVVFTRLPTTTQAGYRALAEQSGIPLMGLVKVGLDLGLQDFEDNPAAFCAKMDAQWDKRKAPMGSILCEGRRDKPCNANTITGKSVWSVTTGSVSACMKAARRPRRICGA